MNATIGDLSSKCARIVAQMLEENMPKHARTTTSLRGEGQVVIAEQALVCIARMLDNHRDGA